VCEVIQGAPIFDQFNLYFSPPPKEQTKIMSTEDKYARSIAKVVVGQLMTAEGLDSAQRSTIDILSDLLVRYIVEIGAQSHMYAELSHRTECSPTDMVRQRRLFFAKTLNIIQSNRR
jgi:histone H3/H4